MLLGTFVFETTKPELSLLAFPEDAEKRVLGTSYWFYFCVLGEGSWGELANPMRLGGFAGRRRGRTTSIPGVRAHARVCA